VVEIRDAEHNTCLLKPQFQRKIGEQVRQQEAETIDRRARVS
jgi:hypothetical protein